MKPTGKKLIQFLKKYRYVIVVLLAGIVLLVWPSQKPEPALPEEPQKEENDYGKLVEKRLSVMLGKISGAGRVEVMLTLARGPRTEFQEDVQKRTDENQTDEERKTVILSGSGAYDEAAVSAVQYPAFQGALVICEGADSAAVRLDILNAVSAVTGLGSDRITVVKMK